ncbi:hypothetical protein QTO34_006568 [Cnephaeus nilssonii]|uniref:OTU domain-containing protein n=1 Tax=Cnephaeus nilssonii TaxID=3371016 RepID=A0AA40HLN6_CNENI|nr:hypothetical protein QTO34_006568 [Eptesicus nilssonii]
MFSKSSKREDVKRQNVGSGRGLQEGRPALAIPPYVKYVVSKEFGKYCDYIINAAAWGGQLELRTLSHILHTPIEIIQADSPSVVIGEEYKKQQHNTCIYKTCIQFRRTYNSVTWLTVAELHPIGDPETSASSGRCETTPDFNHSHKGHIQEADSVSTKALLEQVLPHKRVSSTATLPL